MSRGFWLLPHEAQASKGNSASYTSALADLNSLVRQTMWPARQYPYSLKFLADSPLGPLREYRITIEELESLEAFRDEEINALSDLNRLEKLLTFIESKSSAGSVSRETKISQLEELRAMSVIFYRLTKLQHSFDAMEQELKNLTETFERMRRITEGLQLSDDTNSYAQPRFFNEINPIQRRIHNLMRQMGLEVKDLRYWKPDVKESLGWLEQSKEIFGSGVYQRKLKTIEEIQTLLSRLRDRLRTHIHDRPQPRHLYCFNCTQTSLLDHISDIRQISLVLEKGRERYIERRDVWERYVWGHMTWLK